MDLWGTAHLRHPHRQAQGPARLHGRRTRPEHCRGRPRLTSRWGAQRWQKPLTAPHRKMSRHDAAGIAIGRRALGHPIRDGVSPARTELRARGRTAPPPHDQSDRARHRTAQAAPGNRGREETRPPTTDRPPGEPAPNGKRKREPSASKTVRDAAARSRGSRTHLCALARNGDRHACRPTGIDTIEFGSAGTAYMRVPKGCPVIPGGRTTTATAPRHVVGTPEYAQCDDAPPPCDAPHPTPRADPPGITGQLLAERRRESALGEKIAGVEIPDTRLAAEATTLVREAEPPLLFDHSRRVYLFGMLQGIPRGLKPNRNCSTSERCSTTWV